MKIAFFVSNRTAFPGAKNEITASSSVVASLIKHLSDRHEITLYAPVGSVVPEGVHLIDLGLAPFLTDSSTANADWVTKTVLGMKQIYIGELFADAHKYDIIHLHTEPSYLAMPYAKLIKTPVLFTSHNEYHEYESALFAYFEDRIHFSGLSKRQVERMPFKKRPPVIYNGIETDEFPFVDGGNAKNYYLFFGRLNEDKGIDEFLKLPQSLPDFKFYIAGKGDAETEKRINSLSDTLPNLTFCGMMPYKSTGWYDLLSHAKALVMPIRYEDTCPLVPLEAMACGTPVIAYAKGALPEQIAEGQTGYMVEAGKTDELVKAIRKMDSMTPPNYDAMRKAARMHVEKHFGSSRMAAEYEALYTRIVQSG